jgi:hypothetical protein
MIYTDKHNLKIIKRMRAIADKKNPADRQEKVMARDLSGLSRGGEKERSHNKLVGNIAKKNSSIKYDTISKAHERIEKLYKRHFDKVDNRRI